MRHPRLPNKILETGSPDEFMKWFPEIDRRIFTNIRGLKIVITAEDYLRRPTKFIYKKELVSNRVI